MTRGPALRLHQGDVAERGFYVWIMSFYEYFRAGRRFPAWRGFLPALSIPFATVLSLHFAALAVMLVTEAAVVPKLIFALAWGFLNFFWLMLVRRPGVAAVLSLTMIVTLILVSSLKHEILLLTASFIDLMIIDTDTVSFLLTIYPDLGRSLMLAGVLVAALLALLWWLDPYRIRMRTAAAGAAACFVGMTALSYAVPMEHHEAFYGDSFVSKFMRTGVEAMSELSTHGLFESDAMASGGLKVGDGASCGTTTRRPHIIMVLDESSFDITAVSGVKVPAGYRDHFRSFDGKQRAFVVEGTGGPTWYTEYNVLTGLSARSFGRFAYFVTRIAAGRVERGLPLALQRCGYKTFTLYPAAGAFLSARSFHITTGIQRFVDAHDMASIGVEPDRFYYDKAARMIERERGNGAKVDEYVRRQGMSARDYADFLARLKRDFPRESFLLVRFGDHQPEFAERIIDPTLDADAIAQRVERNDPRYFTTYYAIDTINFKPVDLKSALDTLEAPYLPLVIQEAAGLPLDPSFAEQKSILQRCGGAFYLCN